MILKIAIALIAATVAFIVGARMIAQRASRPDRLGVVSGKLLPCPGTPNCISSFEGHDPFTYTGDRATVRSTLLEILGEWPRAELIQSTEDYIHVEFRSRVFSFIDDGEFYLPDNESAIHYRSAARTGRSDLGANGDRMAAIGNSLDQSLKGID